MGNLIHTVHGDIREWQVSMGNLIDTVRADIREWQVSIGNLIDTVVHGNSRDI